MQQDRRHTALQFTPLVSSLPRIDRLDGFRIEFRGDFRPPPDGTSAEFLPGHETLFGHRFEAMPNPFRGYSFPESA